MASVINIVAISVNRYWSIAYPISYRRYARQDLVYLVMGFVWCLSFRKSDDDDDDDLDVCSSLVNFAPGIWLLDPLAARNASGSDCSGDYNHSFIYMLIAQFNYFIWPFVVLCLLNMLIMLNIWKRTRKMTRLMSHPSSVHVPPKTKKKTKTRMQRKQRSAVIGRENRVFFRLDSPCSYHRHLMNAKEKCSLANAVDPSSHLASLTTTTASHEHRPTISTKILVHSSDTLSVHCVSVCR